MKISTILARLSMPVVAGVAVMGLAAGPAFAADTALTFDCQATPPVGSPQVSTLDAGISGTAPASVTSGSAFQATLTPDPLTISTTSNGYTVNSISNLQLSFAIPTGATLTGESLSGGSGVSGATVAVSGGNVVVSVPGPIAGGATITLPVLTLDLTAGAAGGSVQTQVAGTSYTDPGLTFTSNVTADLTTADVPSACYVPDSPALTTTTVD